MLSYKKWKESLPAINESVGTTFTLGVRSPQTIGVVGSNLSDVAQTLEEAKKKCAAKKCTKKMDADIVDEPEPEEKDVEKPEPEDKPEPEKEPEEPEEGEPEEKDEPEEKPDVEEPKDKPTLFQKKQKKKMKKEDVEFWTSLQKQLHSGLPGEKFWDGISEEALFSPNDPNKGLEEPDAENKE